MEELTKISKLLGEENEKRLKDTITDLLIEQVENDLNDMNYFMIDYESLFVEAKEEVKAIMKDKLMKKYMEKAEDKLSELFEE